MAITDPKIIGILNQHYRLNSAKGESLKAKRLFGVSNKSDHLCLAEWLAMELACCKIKKYGSRLPCRILPSSVWTFDAFGIRCDVDFNVTVDGTHTEKWKVVANRAPVHLKVMNARRLNVVINRWDNGKKDIIWNEFAYLIDRGGRWAEPYKIAPRLENV